MFYFKTLFGNITTNYRLGGIYYGTKKIRVLAIAPYRSMAKQLASVVKEFPDIELTIHVGDREEGIRLAQENYHSNYDMILSRGGTATLLHSTVSLPIIEIETSAYDILSILKLAYLPSQKTAILGYPNITKKFKAVCSLLDYDITLYEIDSEENLALVYKGTIRSLKG